jgi:hypothetical protein
MKRELSCSLPGRRRYATGLGALGGLLCLPLAAEAYVKWFASLHCRRAASAHRCYAGQYLVWVCMALALAFFLATRAVETSKIG